MNESTTSKHLASLWLLVGGRWVVSDGRTVKVVEHPGRLLPRGLGPRRCRADDEGREGGGLRPPGERHPDGASTKHWRRRTRAPPSVTWPTSTPAVGGARGS